MPSSTAKNLASQYGKVVPDRLFALVAHFLMCYVALVQMRLMQADVEAATGTRPSAGAVAEALSGMVGHRLDANVYHFDYRTELTNALCSCVGIDLSRQVMTKSQMNKVMSVVKKPRS